MPNPLFNLVIYSENFYYMCVSISVSVSICACVRNVHGGEKESIGTPYRWNLQLCMSFPMWVGIRLGRNSLVLMIE